MSFDELVARCKAGVHLDANEHRNYYESIAEYFSNREDAFDQNEIARFQAAACVLRLQFYPDTPVGFYVVYGTTLTEVLEKAELCFQ